LGGAATAAGMAVVWALVGWAELQRSREPPWVQNVVEAPQSLPEFATGNLLPTVKTGHMCRKYMGAEHPDMLKFNNGLAAGVFRDAIFVPRFYVHIW